MIAAMDLLEEAHRALKTELAPSLQGDARLTALMAASAIRTVQRELELAERLAGAEAALPRDAGPIRAGDYDGDADLYERLLAATVLRAHIADPSAPTVDERQRWIEEEGAS